MSSQPTAAPSTPLDSLSEIDVERHNSNNEDTSNGDADGSLTAWLQVAMGWLVIFTTWGYINSFGAFQAYYNESMPESPSTISWIGSIQSWLTFAVGSFSGRLLDAGYFKVTMWFGATLQLLGIFLMSISEQYWSLLLTQGILTGIGGGLMFTPTVALVSTYFTRRRAVAIGIMTTGNSTGGIVYPVVVRQLLPSLGFAWAARVLGFINLACFVVVLLLMRPKPASGKLTLGNLFDFRAFQEPVFLAVVAGIFFSLWGIISIFYFVSAARNTSFRPRRTVTKPAADCTLRTGRHSYVVRRCLAARHSCQRRRLTGKGYCSFVGRQGRDSKYREPGCCEPEHRDLLLAGRQGPCWRLPLRRILRPGVRRFPGADANYSGKHHKGHADRREQNRHGLCRHLLLGADGSSDRGCPPSRQWDGLQMAAGLGRFGECGFRGTVGVG